MANTYVFIVADNSSAQRSPDMAFIPWNPTLNQPADIDGVAGRTWREDGSPTPDPYVVPPPTADEIRHQQYDADTDRQDIVSRIKDATPQQVKNWINANATDFATMKTMLVRLTLLVGKTMRD